MKANHDNRYAGKTDILRYALALITVNGGTTTNEVKFAMRQDNFWIRQEEVSVALNELSQEHEWDEEETGVYRIYRFPGQQQLQQQVSAHIIVAPNVPPLSSPQAVTDYIKAHVAWADKGRVAVQQVNAAMQQAKSTDQPVPLTTQAQLAVTEIPQRGDWFAFDYSDAGKPEVFITGSPDRNTVRNFYSKEYNSQYRAVAANIIK